MQGEHTDNSPLRIGIIGGGFSGISLAAALSRVSREPISLTIFEKTGRFGEGDAYSTSFPFHFLNVRARDMSAIEEEPEHFLNWLRADPAMSVYFEDGMLLEDQFLPRYVYAQYLKDLLERLTGDASGKVSVKLSAAEVTSIDQDGSQMRLHLDNGDSEVVDKAVLALGNPPTAPLSFPLNGVHQIDNPWDYTAIREIGKKETVLIIGTGLSMIDTVLSLYYQKHEGKILAVSRRGLLPLTHSDTSVKFEAGEGFLSKLRPLTKGLRQHASDYANRGGDWRSIINSLRDHLPQVWKESSLSDKKRFLRHLLPYWNIHRHRVQPKVMAILEKMVKKNQLKVLAGRVLSVASGQGTIVLRGSNKKIQEQIDCVVNCMGPAWHTKENSPPLIESLLSQGYAAFDELKMGFSVTSRGEIKNQKGDLSAPLYSLGAPVRGTFLECTAVPEIRKQSAMLATQLLEKK